MSRMLKLYVCLFAGFVFCAQAADEWRLCILVDGSQKMVTEKSYYAVLSALETKILVAQKQQVVPVAWSVEVTAIGVTKKMIGAKRYFGNLPVYPCPPGVGFSPAVAITIPNVTDESPITCEQLKSQVHTFISDKAALNSGVVIISDQSNVNLFGSKVKYHKNILVEVEKTAESVIPSPKLSKISDDVKVAFDDFFAYVNEQTRPPVINVELIDKGTVFVGEPVRIKIKGSSLKHAVITYGNGAPSVEIEQTDVDRVLETTFAAAGEFTVEAKGVCDSRETVAKINVTVVERPPVLTLTIARNKDYCVGDSVKFNMSVKNATETTIDYGDNTPSVKYEERMKTEGAEHVYQTARLYKVVMTAKGAGGNASESCTITIMDKKVVSKTDIKTPIKNSDIPKKEPSRPEVNLAIANAKDYRVGEAVKFNVSVKNATETTIDYGDNTPRVQYEERMITEGAEHVYQTAGSYKVDMTANGAGGKASESCGVTIKDVDPPLLPKAAFDLESGSGVLEPKSDNAYQVSQGKSVRFKNMSKNAKSYRWSFEPDTDSGAKKDANIEHVFQNAGEYTVTLTAYSESGMKDTETKTVRVIGGWPIWPFILVMVLAAITGGTVWVRRPQLTVAVSTNGQEGNARAFGLLDHRVALSDLSKPIECRARKVEGLWQVEFRSLDDRVLERLPSQTPIRLEARTWTLPMNPGDFVLAGTPNEVIKFIVEQ